MERNTVAHSVPAAQPVSGLEPWRVSELPRPPAITGLNILGIIGPGAILLGLSLGSGEWLLGPAAFVRYGLPLLWVTTVAVVLQTVLNTELIRYTLYTGESALTGFMRTRPGSTFWSVVYAVLYFLQVGWPAWAGTSAGAIFYLFVGRLAGPGDAGFVQTIGAATFLLCMLTLLIGQRIERTLEILNWILIIFILGGLSVLCLIYAAPENWLKALAGYIGFNPRTSTFDFIPAGADWFLISAFAAYSGAGGVVNLMLSNWARDKGFGMARVGGYISAAIGGRKVKLAHVGSVFMITPESLTRWRGWWRIVSIDQWLLFGVGALLAMGLPAILYTSFIEPGRDIRGLAVAAELSNAMSVRGSAVLPFLVALMGAWVLFKTQLDIVDGLVRAMTDILWTGSRRVREWRGGDVRYVYYTILAVVVVWGLIALRVTQPIVLLQLGANVAGLVFVISALHILYLNTHFLPKELRPPVWRRIALVALAIFYGSFVYLWLMGGVVPDPTRGFLFNIPHYFFGG